MFLGELKYFFGVEMVQIVQIAQIVRIQIFVP